ncbi:MAG: hypothetical protein RLZZ182_1844 [Pseudomonadota bacterium]|jgi:hypothetical protein
MNKIKGIFAGAVVFADRVFFGTKLGKVIIVTALVGLGLPAMQAAPLAEILNTALDTVTVGG